MEIDCRCEHAWNLWISSEMWGVDTNKIMHKLRSVWPQNLICFFDNVQVKVFLGAGFAPVLCSPFVLVFDVLAWIDQTPVPRILFLLCFPLAGVQGSFRQTWGQRENSYHLVAYIHLLPVIQPCNNLGLGVERFCRYEWSPQLVTLS